MASHSTDDAAADDASQNHEIIPFIPRQRVRQRTQQIFVAMAAEADIATVRRMIADAYATFGDELAAELHRACERGPQGHALAAIHIMLQLASEAAHQALWAIGHDPAYAAGVRLAALRGLVQQGADVPISQLVTLANLCERGPHSRDLP